MIKYHYIIYDTRALSSQRESTKPAIKNDTINLLLIL